MKLHNLHWNVQGQQFFGIHEKLEEFYDATAEELDAIAERVLTLGHRPFSSMADYLKAAELKVEQIVQGAGGVATEPASFD